MHINSIGFIGGGRIARIMLQGLKKADALPGSIFVADTNRDGLQKIKALFPEITPLERGMAGMGRADLIFLAVHPPVLMNALAELKAVLKPETVVCSLAPKISVEKITAALGGRNAVCRMNPNAASIVCAGFNPVYFPPSFPAALKKEMLDLLGALGQCPEVDEKKLEAFAVISAMGPTYLWFQFYHLLGLAKQFGMNDEEALAAVSGMAVGAGRTMGEAGLSPAEVMDLVPVRPLAESEEEIKKIYTVRLTAMHAKLTA